MNLSFLFYIAAAVLFYLVGFGWVDAVHGQVTLAWVAAGLGFTGLAIAASGSNRRLG
jgi:hypothetical protein